MKGSENVMKTRLFVSVAIALFSVATYPSIERIANAERGGRIDNVFGGEEMLLIFGLFIALMIIVEGIDKLLWENPADKKGSSNPKVTASQTESEESESKSL